MAQHYIDFGGTGPLLHLATANGFPPEAYSPFARQLAQRQRVVGYINRPLWPNSQPHAIQRWHDLADDILIDLPTIAPNESVIGMGHSLGGIITLYAALRHPARFHALVLCDPVIMPRHMLPLIWLARRLGLHRRSRLVRGAERRRAHFPSAELVLERYRGRSIFAGWHPDAMEGYIAGGLRPTPDGVTLAWSTAWESHIFSLVPIDTWNAIARVPQPLLLMRGTNSDLITDRSWTQLQRLLPNATLVAIDGGHMFPMERPHTVAEVVQRFLDTLPPIT